jgi:predicted metal-dependent hydrolase
MISETIQINNQSYTLKIYYECRNNVRTSIRKKIINIRIPTHLSKKQKHQQLESMKQWAIHKIQSNPEQFKAEKQKTYTHNQQLQVGIQHYTLDIQYYTKKTSSAYLKDTTIYLRIADHLSEKEKNNHISHLISRCIAKKQLPLLIKKINGLNNKYFNQNLHNISYKNNKTNWGSCSQQGNINISTRLLFAPEDVLDYVCIHELAHLIEPNHSKKFWNHVQQAMPEYKQKKQWLKEHGKNCRF